MKSLEQRIFELEQKVAELSRQAGSRPPQETFHFPDGARPGVIPPRNPWDPPFIFTSEAAR